MCKQSDSLSTIQTMSLLRYLPRKSHSSYIYASLLISSYSFPYYLYKIYIMATSTTGSQFVLSLPTIPSNGLPERFHDQECTVCLMTYLEHITDTVQLPCRHVFHRVCLTAWLSENEANKNTCPICRRALFAKLEDTFILNTYDGMHERIEFSRRLSDPAPAEFWRGAFVDLMQFRWFCLSGPHCDEDWFE